MGNFIYYEKLKDYEKQVEKAKLYDKLQKQLADIKFYIEQSDIKNMLWGKEILKIIEKN